jgi:hypothetical protein
MVSAASGVLADPLLGRFAAAWTVLTDSGQLAVVKLAERLAGAIRNGLAVVG